MNLQYAIFLKPELNNPSSMEACKAFGSDFPKNQMEFPMEFLFDPSEIEHAKIEIGRRGILSDIIFNIKPDKGNWDEFPAYFLGYEFVNNLIKEGKLDGKKLAKSGIAKDLKSRVLLGSAPVQTLLAGIVNGVEWNMVGESAFEFSSALQTTNPIEVLVPTEIRENHTPAGTWTILSDGREVISNDDTKLLKENGLLLMVSVRANGVAYPVEPRFIASPKVMKALESGGFKNLVKEPFPLLNPDSPLLSL